MYPKKYELIEHGQVWYTYVVEKNNKKILIKTLSSDFIRAVDELKDNPDEAIILPKVKNSLTIAYYRSEQYAPLKDGMHYIYLKDYPRKLVVGGFSKILTLENMLLGINFPYADYNIYNLVRVIEW